MGNLHCKTHQLMSAQAQIKPPQPMERGHPLNAMSFPARAIINNLVYASYATIICMAVYSKMAVGLLKDFTLVQRTQRAKNSSIDNQCTISKHDTTKCGSPLEKNNIVPKH
ncbi:uncharacterized protein LOC125487471 isoform X2 [Rhincodon typus]|nr:uncharacterized protein LOC125487471 isoform X2 [Rhincodon typus]